ncbi:ABC transporter ATP-binding protein/permease [Myxococcota bacterium]|nr:ABC transporter ATP-binding protein/permease [Myxococcota bacterium]
MTQDDSYLTPAPAPDPAVPLPTDDAGAPPGALRDIARLLGLSLRYWESLVAVILLGFVLAATRYVRGWLIQPLLDDVALPLTAEGLDWEAASPLLSDIGLILAATFILSPFAVLGRGYFSEWSAARVRQRVDIAVANKFLHVPLKVFRDGSSGDFMSRAMADAQIACQAVTLVYKDVLINAQMLVGGVAMMAWLSWELTILAMLAVPPFSAILNHFMTRLLKNATRRQETQADLSDRLIAILSGIKVIKVFRGQAVEQSAFNGEAGKYFRHHMKVIKNAAIAKAASEAMYPIVGVAVMGFGGYAVVSDLFGLTLGKLTTFGYTLTIIYKPVRSLTLSVPRMLESAGSARRLFEILDLGEEVVDRPNAGEMTGLARDIRFRGVSFDYHAGRRGKPGQSDEVLGRPVLDGIDLDVQAGEVIAVVGRTGAGKSTLVELVLRFHDPTEGSIEVDGIDLRDLKRTSFLDNVALVTQEPFLFDESIRENIRYGRPESSDEEVHAAAVAASADDFIADLPEGYDTLAGEFGLRLSGGQRQRITIARAILANASILVFDEATSALDPQTERAVQEAIEGLRGQRTIFLVAHRLSTIERADRIVVLDEGRIAETGDHASLVEKGGIYSQLIGAQSAQASGTTG